MLGRQPQAMGLPWSLPWLGIRHFASDKHWRPSECIQGFTRFLHTLVERQVIGNPNSDALPRFKFRRLSLFEECAWCSAESLLHHQQNTLDLSADFANALHVFAKLERYLAIVIVTSLPIKSALFRIRQTRQALPCLRA